MIARRWSRRLRFTTFSILALGLLDFVFVARATSSASSPRPAQVITVEAQSSHSRIATLRVWRQRANGSYVQVRPAIVANVGINGVRPTREGLGRTPPGVFTLTQAFGNEANNGTRLPYFRAGPDDWWDENPASPRYNHHVHQVTSPGGNSENLYYSGAAYAHAVVINYNTDPVVKGAGSGFFLHVSLGVATEGCVAVPAGDLTWIMRWLNPMDHPVISIGVGSAALKDVSAPPSS